VAPKVGLETLRPNARRNFAVAVHAGLPYHAFVSEVTRLLEASGRGEDGVQDKLLNLVYAELHRMANQRLAGELPGQTLQTTALVHDAWLQLVEPEGRARFVNRAHFFGAAAQAMRRILIDRARRRVAEKRGGGAERLDLDSIELAATAADPTLLRVDDALAKLAREDRPAAELVQLRFFVGMRLEEAAEVLGISERTAKRCWQVARAWLYDELSGQPDD
jgi:RNA polymerase sigma factor (TIGR02999 family)